MSTEKTQNNEIDEILLRVADALGAKNDLEIAKIIGSKSTGLVSNWRKSKKVPDGALSKISQKSGVSIQWLKTGEGEMRPSQVAGHSDPAVQALVEDELTGTETTLQLTGRELRLIRLFRGATPDRQQRLYDLATEDYLVSKEEKEG